MVIGDFLCTKCYAIPLDDPDSFYEYMKEEHRLAMQSEGEGESEMVDESLMDVADEPVASYMEESDEEEDDPGYTLSQGSSLSQASSLDPDVKTDYYMDQATKIMGILQSTFGDLKLPKTAYPPGTFTARSKQWKMRGELQNLLLAMLNLMFPASPRKVALDLWKKAFDGLKDMIEQGFDFLLFQMNHFGFPDVDFLDFTKVY